MIFSIICGLILIIIAGIFLSNTKKEKVKEEVIPKDKQPVLIELLPKGTGANPVLCKVNDIIAFQVKGYSDYKKENEVALNGGYIKWCKSCPCGKWEKQYGVDNFYYAPDINGFRDIWIVYNDGKLITSAKSKLLIEV